MKKRCYRHKAIILSYDASKVQNWCSQSIFDVCIISSKRLSIIEPVSMISFVHCIIHKHYVWKLIFHRNPIFYLISAVKSNGMKRIYTYTYTCVRVRPYYFSGKFMHLAVITNILITVCDRAYDALAKRRSSYPRSTLIRTPHPVAGSRNRL